VLIFFDAPIVGIPFSWQYIKVQETFLLLVSFTKLNESNEAVLFPSLCHLVVAIYHLRLVHSLIDGSGRPKIVRSLVSFAIFTC
jgi:hypothetical protein